MQSHEIRRVFTDFFVERGHQAVPSSSLIPHNDPTVLLTTAGMQQMTPYFLGLEDPPATRMTSIQKCFRAVGKDDDVMEVGDDTHLTFFEMLGNFSVGDYFKDTAIDFAWDLVTEGFGIHPGAVWITVNPEDDYSRDYWRDKIGIPARKIQDDPDNVWGPVGDTGPCGPNSEIYFDFDFETRGDDGRGPMSEDEDRYIEFWNLVFMEFFQEADGTRRQLTMQNVDTGMGLERIAAVLQGKRAIHETDLFFPIIERVGEIAGITYGEDLATDRALRIIADHGRGISFLVADGVLPGNEGRGYVLRRIMRRTIQKGKTLGVDRPILTDIADVVVNRFGDQYPELRARREHIDRVLDHEEEAFSRTLETGLARFESLLEQLNENRETVIPGADAFRLHDTYGFPIDLTVELATTEGYDVDLEGFRAALQEQRARSRSQLDSFADTSRQRAPLYAALGRGHSEFVGYDEENAESSIYAILGVEERLSSIDSDESIELVLKETPFYGESGGQVGDTGEIITETGRFKVVDTQRPTPDLIVHRGHVTEGYLEEGQPATATVNSERRAAIRKNHTATHLVHQALRSVIGEGAQQAGSLVAPDRLRFDFTSQQALGEGGLDEVMRIANAEVLANKPIRVNFEPYDEAVSRGAMALFGEKYGDVVRVVEVPGYSVELCGGTHVTMSGEIGPIVVTSESSIGSGIRRIEALTGPTALNYLLSLYRRVSGIAQDLRVPVDAVAEEVGRLRARLRELDGEVSRLQIDSATSDVDRLLEQAMDVDGTRVVTSRLEVKDRNLMLQVGDRVRDKLQSGVIALGGAIDGQPALIVIVTKDQTERGLHAGRIIQEIAPMVGGRGGGRPELAQGGGSSVEHLDDALAAVPNIVKSQVAG